MKVVPASGTSLLSTNELAPRTTKTASGALNGKRRRASSGVVKAIMARMSNQSGPSGPFLWPWCRTVMASPTPSPTTIAASNQYRTASGHRRFTSSSSHDRKPRAKPVAAARPRSGLELAAVDGHALAHADEAVSTLVAVAPARAVVAHGELDVPVAVADEHLRLAGSRVLQRVRQALLDEPVLGEVDSGRQLLRRAFDAQLDRKPSVACMLDELVEVLEARLRGEGRRLFGPAKDADHPPHLRERLAAGLLDDQQGLTLLLLVRPEQPPRRRGLHGHHADAVADDVMQLAGDPRALVRHRQASPFLPLALGAGRPLSGHIRLVELAAEREPDRPGNREDEAREDEVAEAALGVVVGHDGRDAEPDRETRGRLCAFAERAHQDERRDRDQDGDETVGNQPPVDERGGGDRHAHRHGRAEREAAADEERQRDREDRQQVEPERACGACLLVLGERHLGEADADADQDEGVEPVTARQ